MEHRKMLLAGEWTDGPEQGSVIDPFKGEAFATFAMGGPDQLEKAIDTASRVSGEMRQLPRYRIARGLRSISDGIRQRKKVFIDSIVQESAKPIRYARGEVERAIEAFSWAAGEAERYTGELVPVDTQPSGKGKFAYTRRVPRGVVFGITPFNFPLNLVAHKVAPALASGNAIIIKPTEKTPLTALLLGEVFLESGLPKSALQVVPLDVRYLDPIYEDDRVGMISFTGSDKVGWKIKERAPKKFVTLELGGNAAVIVDDTADIESSISKTLVGGYAYSGQVCISVQRVLLQEKIFDEWTSRFAENASKLKKGDPDDESTELSVMIDEDAAKRAHGWITEALDGGAEALTGNGRDGSMLDAYVLTNTDPEMKVVAEEAFAPLVVLEPFSSFQDAISMANHSRFGLQAGVFTTNEDRMNEAAEQLEYGGVIINDAPTFRVDNMPYGGFKDSGFGREGVRYAMDEMTEPRIIVRPS